MRLYRSESSDPKINAQRNLCGRTHYVDEETLRFHKSRVLSARATDNGLLFAIVTSDAMDMHNRKRGFRYSIFDLFGTVLSRPDLENAFSKSDKATKAMWAALNEIDAKAVTLAAIEESERSYIKEMAELREEVSKLEIKAA
jgi:hypothetical protein